MELTLNPSGIWKFGSFNVRFPFFPPWETAWRGELWSVSQQVSEFRSCLKIVYYLCCFQQACNLSKPQFHICKMGIVRPTTQSCGVSDVKYSRNVGPIFIKNLIRPPILILKELSQVISFSAWIIKKK